MCPSDFDFLSARFSFRDLPDFFVMLLRGDLSDIASPLIGNLSGPGTATLRSRQLLTPQPPSTCAEPPLAAWPDNRHHRSETIWRTANRG